MNLSHAERIARATTNLPPCAIQACPQDRSVMLVGTYKLNEDGTRHGSLDVYQLTETNQLSLIQSVHTTSSILDIKISPHDTSLAMSAQSTGSIVVWKVSVDEKGKVNITGLGEYNLFEKDVLVLSIAFSEDDQTILSATLSSGEVAVIKITSHSLDLLGRVAAHSLEAWTCSFGTRALQNVLFSGGDDAVLAAHDLRLIKNEGSHNQDDDSCTVWKSNRIHEAGITSILPSSTLFKPSEPCALWTGGYDDQLRSLDMRLGATGTVESYLLPKVNESIGLEGGVWKLIPGKDHRILACCMYRGGFILDLSDTSKLAEPSLEIKDGHESMVYGGDWISDNSVVTCSFYDKQLQAWRV
jgi:diphthine methyl ester acylhydrolase